VRTLAKVLPAALMLGSLAIGTSPATATLPGVNGKFACWSRQVAPGPTGHWDVLASTPTGAGR